MRNRWFHKPLLHSPALGLEKRATWLELFYDLIFVAAFIQLGNGLSGNVSFSGFAAFVGAFVPLWVSWTGFTFYENRYTIEDFLHRTLVLLQMFAVGGMAIAAPGAMAGEHAPFAIAAAAAQGLVAVMYARAWKQTPESREYARYWGAVFAVSAGLWLVSATLPFAVALWFWVAATGGVLASPLSRPSRALQDRFPIDFEHLGERYGLLTIIVLGESFVKVLSSLVAQEAGITLYLEAGAVLLITCGIWWVYFDDVAGSKIRQGPGRWIVWLYAHIPLQIGITAVGVSVKKAVHFSFDAPAPEKYRWLLAGSLALVYFAVAAIDSVTERKQAELSDRIRVNVRWISGLLLLLLAPAGATLSGGTFLILVMGINVAQVLFDMMMAPFETSEQLELGKKTTAEISREVARGERKSAMPARDVGEAVRKGAPATLRRDLYFYFMEGSWTRVFVAFGVVFVLTNIFFAALYALEPGSISNSSEATFTDAFFFSVQTLSTIGYGTLSPATDYGNVLVTLEAAVGLAGVAIATGLMFAKVSRPRSSVLFSEPIIRTRMHGEDVLMFRVGNARGNDVIDASMDLSVLMDELSPEGHHFRRIRPLKLVRPRTPLFTLTWSVMHEIDEESPLFGVDLKDPTCNVMGFIATLMGHDGTYGQTTYARQMYRLDSIRVDHRFVDVISELPDGRLMVDYGLFHETEEEDTEAPP